MGIVSNASKNPLELPDGTMIQPGETREDFDESSLEGDLFLGAGWLVTGKDAKALQSQLEASDADISALQAKVEELQKAVSDLTLRAETAEAERDQLKADSDSDTKSKK